MTVRTLPCKGKLVKAESRERASVYITGSKKQVRRTIYTDGLHRYIIRGGEFVEVTEKDAGFITYRTKEGY